MNSQTVTTMCPMNCHPTYCGMKVEVKGSRLVVIKGDKDNPDSNGFLCMRGRAAHEIVGNTERLLQPLRRVGKRGTNRWEAISWQEALTLITEKIEKTKRDRVAVWAGHGSLATGINRPLLMRFGFMGGFQVWNPAIVCWALGAYGLGLTGVLEANTKEDLAAHSRTIILWGANLASQPTTAPHLIEARKRGSKVVLIDCRRTEASRHADETLLIRPGTDTALALALAHVIVKEGLTDPVFIRDYTLGFEEFVTRLEQYTPEWAALETGIQPAKIREIARLYAVETPAVIVLGGSSMFKHQSGWEASRAIACLPALTGQLGIKGGGLGPRHRAFTRADGFADLQGIELRPEGKYVPNHMASISSALTGGSIDVMLLLGTNMLSSFADASSIEKGLEKVDLIVGYDIFMNDTIRHFADLVLPGTIWLEELGLKDTASHIYLMERALPVDGKARPLMQILTELAQKLAIDNYFPWQDEEDYLNSMLSPQTTPEGKALTVERLRAERGYWQKSNLSHVAYPDRLFHTPSGKIEFFSERAASVGLDPLPGYTRAVPEASGKYPLQFRQGRTLTAFHSFYDQGKALPTLAKANSKPEVWIHPTDAECRGILAGEKVVIFNDRGHFQASANLTEDILPGVIWMRDGWYGQNHLTSGLPSLTPLAGGLINQYAIPGGQAAYDSQVEIKPYHG